MNQKSFPKSKRVVRGDSFTLVLRRGGCAADDCLVVFAFPAENSDATHRTTRLGVTIPKKTGNAVARNRWKRWIRESFRTQQDAMPEGFDLIVRPKKGASGDWKKIQRALPKLARKASLRFKPRH